MNNLFSILCIVFSFNISFCQTYSKKFIPIIHSRLNQSDNYNLDKFKASKINLNKLTFALFLFKGSNKDNEIKGEWSEYFSKLSKSNNNNFDLHIFEIDDDMAFNYPKVNNVDIENSSLFLIAPNSIDIEKFKSDSNFINIKLEKIEEKTESQLIKFTRKTQESGKKQCGPSEFFLIKNPVEIILNDYSNYLDFQKEKKIEAIDRKISSQDSINKAIFSSIEDLKKISIDQVGNTSYLSFNGNASIGAPVYDLKEVNNLSYRLNSLSFLYTSHFFTNSIFDGYLFGVNFGTFEYLYIPTNFNNSFVSKDFLGNSYTRVNYYNDWRERIHSTFIEIPIGVSKIINISRIQNIRNKFHIEIGLSANLLYINSLTNEVVSGTYSSRGKISGVKDELVNISSMNLSEDNEVSNLLVYTENNQLKLSSTFTMNCKFHIVDNLYLNGNIAYSYFPNLLTNYITNEKSDMLSSDILSSLAFSNKFSFQPFRIGLGLSLKIQ
jgi:hypothetical protein